MYFQVLDSKAECFGLYYDGKIISLEDAPENLKRTWDYSNHLDSTEVECARIICNGLTLDQVCPPEIQEEWQQIKKRLKSFFRSLQISKINLNNYCFYDLVPERFILKYNFLKTEICKHVFEKWQKPENYDFIHALSAVTSRMAVRELNIDEKCLQKKLSIQTSRKVYRDLLGGKNRAVYNVFGSLTGRLTTEKVSFPILTLDSRLRSCLKPRNDLFLELDFNSAELRVLLSLSGQPQPEEDIHRWNLKNIFAGKKLTRTDAKKEIFAWLYNPNSVHKTAELVYNRSKVKNLYYKDGIVTNPFKRSFGSDDFRGLNHIVQSTTSDLFLYQMLKLDKLLAGKKSFISFSLHDSLIIDLDKSEREIIFELVEAFGETLLGTFKTNVALGKNFGNMRKIDVI
jgi:hypothetical protein